MPSLRGHMVFVSALRDRLLTDLPDAGACVAAHWAVALLGSEGPDAWFFSGQTRPDTHALEMDRPETWAGAMQRWSATRPDLAPGRDQSPVVQAFVIGYLSHLGLDTWEQFQHPELPEDARRQAPTRWYPAALKERSRVQAFLRALGDAPFPADRLVAPADLEIAPVPAGFAAEATRRVAAGIAPSLPETDPWRISRINPLRVLPDTPEARAEWDRQRAQLNDASPEEYAAGLDAALDFTVASIRAWW